MLDNYISHQTFSNIDFSQEGFSAGEYESCVFNHCNISSQMLAECRFFETEFNACDLSNANLSYVSFQETVFKDCKMLGLQFHDCKAFAFSVIFENCRLDHASFFKMDLQSCSFDHCHLENVDFSEANLKKVDILACELKEARFDHTNLEKADLRASENYSIDPENNRIFGAKFSLFGIVGLLYKYGIKID